MTAFTPDTPLGIDVQELLLAHSEGLTFTELRRLLRLEKGRHISDSSLHELLSNGRVFTSLANGRYVLAGHHLGAIGQSADQTETPDVTDPWAHPLIVNVPRARHNYVIFDFETTGTDVAHDHIVQIAALKVQNDIPVAVRNWYVHPGDTEIPYTLQIMLGIVDNPSIGQAIAVAPPLGTVLAEFLSFVGNLPLVAYNARFDARFLAAALGDQILDIPVVDALELAMLVAPNLPRHRLVDVAEALELPVEHLTAEWETLSLDSNITGHIVSAATLHNAVTDVYVLFRVYGRLLERLGASGAAGNLLRVLLPEVFDASDTFSGVDDRLLAQLRDTCRWESDIRDVPAMTGQVGADDVLVEYLHATGRAPRSGQQEMQHLVEAALANDNYAMVEAPTGTGKTLAYLTAAVRRARTDGRRVALSTAYRNLQDQLLSEIADLQRHGPVTFRWQVLKGVGNYLCWSQLARYLEEGDPRRPKTPRTLTLAERYVLAYVALWLPGSTHGTVDELSFWLQETLPVARSILHQLRAGPACHPNLQHHCVACPMPAASANAQKADILVLNHALWLADPQRLPAFERLILDEAHTLEDVATNALTQEVSSQTLTDLLDRLYDQRTERGLLPRIRASTDHPETLRLAAGAIGVVRRLGILIDDIGPVLVQFIRRTTGKIDPRFGASYRLEANPRQIHGTRWQHVDDAHRQLFGLHLKDLLDALGHVREAVSDAPDLLYREATLRELSEQIDRLAEQRQRAYDLVKVNDQTLVYWIDVGPPTTPNSTERDPYPQWWAFKAAPINVGAALQSYYERLNSVCFVSATLALRGSDFSFFIDRLGLTERLNHELVRRLPPALPYSQNVLLGLTDYLTYAPLQQTLQSFQEELAAELRLLLQFTGGRALGLFSARARMEFIADRIAADLARYGIPLYVQKPDTSRARLLETFKERREAVLFGLRSFWEGVDAPGETLSFVLMEKLPFPLLIEPVHKARAEQLTRAGRSEFDDYMLPLMLLQFKQGFGRLMRREDDCGAVILFDKRIHRKHYKADLLSSLPGYRPRDEVAERSRRRFYAAIVNAFPHLIDTEAQRSLLDDLPDDIAIDFESVLAQYQLPERVPHDQYDQLRPMLLAALKTLFRHDSFRTIDGLAAQEQVIRHILAGDDVLGVLPTGAGKSLTFQLTALLRQGVTLVFSPLIALMKDQVAGLNERGIEVIGAIYSGQSASERDDVLERMRRGRARLVYVAPERLRDPRLLAALREARVMQVIVDEAHCVYMWGPSFRPDFLALPRLFDVLGYRPPIAALTATATSGMQEAIIESLALRNPARVVAPIDRPELQFVVFNAQSRYGAIGSRNARFRQLLRVLQAADHDRSSTLIYVATTVEAEQIARSLQVAGYDARAYHGKMDPADRASVQDMFMDDHINIVVCTKAFGMGIDKPNIRYVIHYNMPGDLESYFQEAGRAGRNRETAYCVLLYHPSDIDTQTYFIENSTPDEATINRVLDRLAALEGDKLFLDPDVLQDELGLEEVQIRVALHYLEMQGYLRRDTDFTLAGTLTFQIAPAEALAAWRIDAEPEVEFLADVLRATGWPPFRKLEVNLMSLARQLGCRPDAIDHVLLRLALRGEVIYRPWRRGLVLEKTALLCTGQMVSAGALAAEQHRDELHRKLSEMIAYASSNTVCRRAVILHYFGQDTADHCAGCDVCEPEREWPWSLMSSRDVGTPDNYVDPAFILLETVHWNQARAQKYGAPYGTGTMLAILKGDQFAAVRYETDPHLKRWRIQQVRSCPNWGVLALLPARDRVTQATLERLISEGYLCQQRHARADGAGYDYLALTQKGIEQLTSGRLLQWQIN
jgi:ATP-dependent DNA helicase RecQ